jgi:hypothetical protein
MLAHRNLFILFLGLFVMLSAFSRIGPSKVPRCDCGQGGL